MLLVLCCIWLAAVLPLHSLAAAPSHVQRTHSFIIIMDGFLNVGFTSEKCTSSSFEVETARKHSELLASGCEPLGDPSPRAPALMAGRGQAGCLLHARPLESI